MKSTMFVNGITQIDHAYIDTDGMVVGEELISVAALLARLKKMSK